ncbi:MAG: hypothetical protein Q9192_005093 [Flavoplaca navasiana]
MSAIGRVTASALAATNENTFGLANFNIDFSLVKVEAPIEYRGLRSALSRHRVENAEQGPQHRTARRLGALFEQILPPIKTLAEAYGRRSSQIAETEKQKSPTAPCSGPFAQHIGLDGTSIYAAATSGSSAIAVHLLACLLARTWSGPEAIAIWVELVAERKRDINENTDASQIQGLAARVAAQQEISRADLASWDASARAWLLSADETQKFRLTQLRLIIKDSGLLVSSFGNTHDSVIDVWTTAMKTLQDLVLGRPQRISKGALLIGLSCWHIFPDLNVVDPLTHVKFNDELVAKGGVVTLGLQSASPDNDPGVQWSLSLSHLRYYGNPVIVTSHTSALGSRISMENLHMVVLGSVFGTWGQCFTDAYAGAQLIKKGELPEDMHRNIPYVSHFKWTDPPEQFHYKYDEESGNEESRDEEPGDEEPGDKEPSVNTPSDEGRNSVNFYRSFGYNNGACLFHAGNRPETRDLYDWEIQKILEIYVPNLARSTSFSEQFCSIIERDVPNSNKEQHDSRISLRRALSRLVQAANIYRRFPGATVPISIVDSRINDASCFVDLNYTLASKFACIAMFETGSHSIQSTQLKSVMAMSSGNAIYVADALIQDPIEPNSYGPQGITRIIGNIDHPGVVMLAPPQAPLIRTENADSWRVIDHHKFDGKLENFFSGTSLHLSFTKYEIPLSVSVGAVDADISMVETLISAHDQKNWVADLDVLSSLRCENFFKRLRPPSCKHANQNPRPPSENAAVQIGKVCGKQLVSIASWEELLDPPGDLGRSTIAVVRAYDNWPARVATMSVCVQKGLSTRVLPTEPLCTVCGNKAIVDIAIGAQVLIF